MIPECSVLLTTVFIAASLYHRLKSGLQKNANEDQHA